MSAVLRLGAVKGNEIGNYQDSTTCLDSDVVDIPPAPSNYCHAPVQTYPGCFGLPYQDHNYGAPPPITPPASPPPPPPPVVEPPVVVNTEKVNGHIEVDEVPVVAATEVAKEISVEDDSVTRCICDYTHDDGYMICCDKCSVWQHIDCMAVDRNNIPESYYCEICEPRPVDKERAYQLQTKRKELLITDSSATDTDPEEAMNRQMSQQQQLANKKGKSKKKTKVKPDKVQPSPVKNIEVKQRKSRREKKDVKKEKENKEADKKQKTAIKEAISKKINKSKLNKKPGLSLVVNENAQDPWDSSYSPWVDKYEEAKVNHYSADILALVSVRVNGQNVNGPKSINGNLLVQRCHVTEVSKNRKGLEASETIGEGEPIIEYTGKVMLKQQFDRDNFFKQFNPFVLFYNKYDNLEICVDATSFGNTARFIRRSCKANAEVQHVVENGEMYFYVYSAKVIPRGSEITIPYDYNYKDCTYCVECACLRNNCPVAKYFKKRQNAQNKKDKAPPKPPKSPGKPVAKSPVKSPTKSPIKKNLEFPKVEPIVKMEVEEKVNNEPEVPPTPEIDPPPDVLPPKEEPVSKRSEVKVVKEEDNNSNSCMDVEASSDVDEGSSGAMLSAASERGHKMTREERKMEAIMKAFEKLEKREERRKEALARMDHKGECKTLPETVPPEVTETAAPEKKTVKIEEPVKEVPVVPPAAVVKEEPAPEPEEPVVTEPVVKRETRPKKKSRKTAARRRSRMSSSCSTETNASLSVDENSNTNLSSGQSTSVPSTPVTADISSPPSFRFLKTKKHLMSEWMNEKSQDTNSSIPAVPIKTTAEPLEVSVEDAMFVTCLPSPRNSMDHLRRNSHSSGGSGGIKMDNSIGSAKKRWLRQAMWDKPIPNNGCTSPIPAGGTSPNPALNNVPSPGASPPGDFVTPLKKRRMARESCDQPVPPTPSTPGLSDVTMSTPDLDRCKVDQDVQGFKPCIFPPTPVTPEDEESNISKKSDEALEQFKRGRDSLDSETSDMHSARTSIDLSDIEQDKTSQNTGSSSRVVTNNLFSEDRIFHNIKSNLLNSSSDSAEVETSSSGVDVCDSEVTKSAKDSEGLDSECDSLQGQRNLADSEMEGNRHQVESDAARDMNKEHEAMEVDSTEGSKNDNKSRTCNKKQTVCDSTSSKVDLEIQTKSLLVTTDSEQAVSGSSSFCHPHSASVSVSKESSVVVDSSTDSKLSRDRVVPMSSEQISVSSADQSIDRNCVSRLDSTALSVADQSIDKTCVSLSDSTAVSTADQSADRHSITTLHSTVVSQSADKNLSDSSAGLVADQSVDRNCVSLSDNFAVSTADQSIDKNNESLLDSTAMTDADQSGDMGSNCVSISSEPSASVAIADQSTDRNIDHSRAEMVVDSGQQDPLHSHDQSNESLVESVSDASSHKLMYSTGTGENVGSSSDKKKCLFDVSSSSESRTSESLSVESSQPLESVNVSSTEQLCPTEDMPSTGGVADSSEATSSCKMDEDLPDIASSVTNSLCGSSISEADTPSAVHGRLGYEDFKQHEASSSSSSSSSHSSMSPAVLEESNQASESLPVPVPAKKKVSLLEYRKRLKEKHTTTSSSSSSSQSPIFSSSQTPPPMPSSSFNNIPTLNKPVSSYSNHSPSSRTQSRRLTSLPSLPLFESSPPKDQSSRHQFKSSSDLIRRKSTETKKREKPLSLSERLKLEFGVDDSEEEKESNDGSKSHHLCTSTSRQASSSSISFTTPPPPPPPPSSTAQSRSCIGPSAGYDRPQEVTNQPIVQPAQGYQQQIYHPQVPPPHVGMHPTIPGDHAQNPMLIRGPSPGLMPTHPTPAGPPLQHNSNPVPNPGMLHPPNLAGQAPQMMNGPGPPPSGPPPRQGGQIPSLMSLQTFPTLTLQQPSNGQTPPAQAPQPTGYQQHEANIDQGQQAMISQEQPQFNQQHAVHGNGVYPLTPPQQNFTQPPNGTNFNILQKSPMQVPPYSPQQSNLPPSGGPVVHDYNHGFNGVHCGDVKQRYHNSPSQYHNPVHNQQRKSKKKKKNKGFNHQHQTYPDSGGHY